MEENIGTHNMVETDMRQLAAEIKSHMTESGKEAREVVGHVLGEKIGITKPSQPQDASQPVQQGSILPSYAREMPPEIKLRIENLVDEIYHKGIFTAINHAKKAPPIVRDALHDILTGKLHDELTKRGMLK